LECLRKYVNTLITSNREIIDFLKQKFEDTLAMINKEDDWPKVSFLFKKLVEIIIISYCFAKRVVKLTNKLKKITRSITYHSPEDLKNFKRLFCRFSILKRQFDALRNVKLNLDISELNYKLRLIDTNDSLREIPISVSLRARAEENMIYLRAVQDQMKQVTTKREILWTNIQLFEQRLYTLDKFNGRIFRRLQKALDVLELASAANEKPIEAIDQQKIEQSISSVELECEKLELISRYVNSLNELIGEAKSEKEKICAESKIESHRKRIMIATAIISCVTFFSIEIVFFTVKKLLRFSIQVLIPLFATGFVSIITTALFFIHKANYIDTLIEHNESEFEKITSLQRNLELLKPEQSLDEQREIINRVAKYLKYL
jgi:hypothetical protein